ncbi:MAG: hypothetical protein R6U44_01965 [Archaeoglobaceae archaeon]
MRKCPNSFKINYEEHLTESKENEYEDEYENQGDRCVGEVKLLVEPFQAEVFTYSRDFLDLKVKSDHSIDFWIVPSREDVDKLLEGEDFDYNSKLSKERTKEHSATGYVSPEIYIVFANRSAHTVTVKLSSKSFSG